MIAQRAHSKGACPSEDALIENAVIKTPARCSAAKIVPIARGVGKTILRCSVLAVRAVWCVRLVSSSGASHDGTDDVGPKSTDFKCGILKNFIAPDKAV